MHSFVEEVLPWMVIAFYIWAYLYKVIKKSKRQAASPAASVALRPVMPVERQKRSSPEFPQAGTSIDTGDHVAKPAPLLDSDKEGMCAVSHTEPMQPVTVQPISPRRRALRNTIIMGEILTPKFKSL